MKRIYLAVIFAFFLIPGKSQYLSNLHATKKDPVFTTYAAPIEHSNYVLDQAYQFMWSNPQEPLGFTSQRAGSFFLAFEKEGEIKWKAGDFHREAVISKSYSDLMQFSAYPFKNICMDAFFDVYTSQSAIWEIQITNEGPFREEFILHAVFDGSSIKIKNLKNHPKAFTFSHNYKRDGWMIKHDIPIVENRKSCFYSSLPLRSQKNFEKFEDFLFAREAQRGGRTSPPDESPVLIFEHEIQLDPGESKSFRIIRAIARQDVEDRDLISLCSDLEDAKLLSRLAQNQRQYSKIPAIQSNNSDYLAVYWNAFNLMRQCMMPPEGESSYNYYVFSREPTWGWGYGGQVFHESLVMLAYAYMNPESAMNSQRVYMERQDTAGFINYRTGPFLNENIPYNKQITSSAPWYNYQNYEIWKITGDRAFLKQAYASGKKYYDYYTANRDTDDDGLAEWGAHAVLESVRDARVASWDQVGWPSNFEGPDINAMLVMEAKSLSKMAESLEYKNEAREFTKEARLRTTLLNDKLWDPETSFFYNIDREDDDFTFETEDDLKIKEITGFLPFWAGCISQQRADSLVNSLFNKNEFWRKYGVPTLSADHPYYNPIGYWNGPVWVQWNYLLFRGLLDYGYDKEAKLLAEKVLDNIAYHLKKDHTFWEFYSADDLQAGWNHTYIWTGIAARMLIDLEEQGLLK